MSDVWIQAMATEVADRATRADDEFEGRTVVVTGATRGIGAATALLFGSLRAHVVVHGRDESSGSEVCAAVERLGGRATWVAGDLHDPEVPARIVAQARESSGALDVLVNNAGANRFHGVLGTTLEDWQGCLDLDLRAAWLLAKAAAPHMPRGSSVVMMSSNHASSTMAGIFPYNIAKAGLRAMSQSVALDLAGAGIRCNTLSPGFIDTPINVTYFGTFDDPAGERARVEAIHPVGRLGSAVEVARAVRFLASTRDAGFITGTELVVDGGRSALMQDPPVS